LRFKDRVAMITGGGRRHRPPRPGGPAVMTPRKYGKMVFLSSTSALGNRGQVKYSTAKAGLPGMARTLAIELGRFNINAVAPGFVDTRMTMQTAGRRLRGLQTAVATQTPLQRSERLRTWPR
jgi:3-oxoacyl-[acyl-carrier protein] reductase